MPQLTAAQEQFLWNDPLAPAGGAAGGVLQATEILTYVNTYNLLVDQDDFLPFGKLKQASYTMRPMPNDGWIYEGSATPRRLQERTGPDGPYYVVPRNTFVFIRLRPYLRLPFYVIGRHNLKIRYVYSGLLLGTGPQVDPGYEGRLYIPLHNFTNEDVNVYIDDSFVSIDFSRTSPLALGAKPPTTLADFYAAYEDTLRLIPRAKIVNRRTLGEYLGMTRPQSSLGTLVPRLERRLRQLTNRAVIDVAIFIGLLAIVFAVVAFIRDQAGETRESNKEQFRQLEAQIANARDKEADELRQRESAMRDIQDLRKDVPEVQNELKKLRSDVDAMKNQQISPSPQPREKKNR